jgi:hypothetical protein
MLLHLHTRIYSDGDAANTAAGRRGTLIAVFEG